MSKLSVRTKILLMLSVALLIFGFSAAAISYKIYLNNSIEQHKRLATGVARLVASCINPNRVYSYLEDGTKLKEYNEIKLRLYKIRECSPDVKFVYVYKIMEDGCHVVFDLDSPDVTGDTPGTVQEFDESFEPYLPDLLEGKEIAPIITDETYGWLLTVYLPIRDARGATQCYAAVDISMERLRTESQEYLFQLAVIFAIIFMVILIADYQLIRNNLIVPLNEMAKSAEDFAFNNEETMEQNLERIKDLKINTGDEIENLYRAFLKMTSDSVEFTKDVQNKNETISKMQNALIITLADLVESRDENTGQHVKKTAAYVKILTEEMQKMGVYKNQVTDKFATDVYNAAPLHDIGKIAVPDSILNKPGRLTEVEFAVMKKHTTAGGKILKAILDMVPEAHYLDEAINLATYHHERWDGRGYPTGLKGEEIPLSARVMAIADVFDALVSRRSYKQGFPLERAVQIITEERGTHFDPKLVDVFLAAKDKFFKVAKEFDNEEQKKI